MKIAEFVFGFFLRQNRFQMGEMNYKTSPHIKHNLRFRDFYLLIKCHISFTVFMFVQIPRNNNLIVEI